MEELDKFRPVIFHVGDGLAEAGIGLHLFLIDLFIEPFLQSFHQRAAVILVKGQAFLGGHSLFFGDGIIYIYITERLQDVAAFVRAMPSFGLCRVNPTSIR